jgi:hypothetical protein
MAGCRGGGSDQSCAENSNVEAPNGLRNVRQFLDTYGNARRATPQSVKSGRTEPTYAPGEPHPMADMLACSPRVQAPSRNPEGTGQTVSTSDPFHRVLSSGVTNLADFATVENRRVRRWNEHDKPTRHHPTTMGVPPAARK